LEFAGNPDRRSPIRDASALARRIVGLHQHINGTEEHVRRAVKIMDRAGVGLGVNLSGGYVTAKPGAASAFEQVQALATRVAPDRFLHYFNLDYTAWNEPDFAESAVRQVETAKRLGAAGLEEYKRLGL